MDKRLIDLVAVPTAFAASAVGIRHPATRPGMGARLADRARDAVPEWAARPDLARKALPVVLDRLPSDELARLLRPNRSRSRLTSFLPHRAHPSRRQQTLKLARNVGAAASATILAVDLVAVAKRATNSHGPSPTRGEDGEAEPTRGTGRRQDEDGSRKPTRAKKVAASR